MQPAAQTTSAADRRRDRWVVAVLIACVTLVLFWEVRSGCARRGWAAFRVTAAQFAGFVPVLEGWTFEPMPIGNDPLEPNVLAFRAVKGGDPAAPPALVRLAHGYNMVDCMRIKWYGVEPFAEGGGRLPSSSPRLSLAGRLQLWRVTSPTRDVSIWGTAMLRAADFAATELSTTDMAFPKVGTPDDPSWLPRGLTVKSFRHPIRNLRLLLRSRWNASRCELLTFLGLRQPAWSSDEVLTLIVAQDVPPAGTNALREGEVADGVCRLQARMMQQLQAFRQSRTAGEGR